MSGNSRGKLVHGALPMAHFLKTKLCKHYTKGYCRFEDSCLFAHDVSELMYRPDMTKTKLCNRLMVEGACFNENCSFAHGPEELRQVLRPGHSAWDSRVSFVEATPAFLATSPVYFPPPPTEFAGMPDPLPFSLQKEPGYIKPAKATRRSANKIPAQHGQDDMMYEPEETWQEEKFVFLEPPSWLASRRWVSLVEHLLWQRRGQMLQQGRILLNMSRFFSCEPGYVLQDEIEDGLSILLREPEWLMEFGSLARQYASRIAFGSEQMQ